MKNMKIKHSNKHSSAYNWYKGKANCTVFSSFLKVFRIKTITDSPKVSGIFF